LTSRKLLTALTAAP